MNTILFDLDGTLMDTAPDLASALNSLLHQHGHATLPYEKIRPYASAGARGLIGLGFKMDETHSDFPQLRKEFLAIYDTCLTNNTLMFPGMPAVLNAIEANNLRWGIVTNKSTAFSQKLLEHFNLAARCACLVGGDMVPNFKPAPDSLLMACELLKVSPTQCAYIGDAERDMTAAKKAGMYAIAALYGYLLENDKPQAWTADSYISCPEEILQFI